MGEETEWKAVEKNKRGPVWAGIGGFALSVAGTGILFLALYLSYYSADRRLPETSLPVVGAVFGYLIASALLLAGMICGMRLLVQQRFHLPWPWLTIAISALSMICLIGLLILGIIESGA